MRMWWGLISTQRQAWKLISDPRPTAKARLLSLNRTQSRVVNWLPDGHYTLRRPQYIMGLIDSPLWKRCGAEEETSAHVLCKCEAVASLRHTYLCSFFLDPVDVRSLEAIWSFTKGTCSHEFDIRLWGTKSVSKRLTCIRTDGAETHLLFYALHSYSWSMIKLCYIAVFELGLFWKLVSKPSEVLLKQMCRDNPTMNESYMDNVTINTGCTLKWTVYTSPEHLPVFIYSLH